MATAANLALEGGDPRDIAHPVAGIHGGEPAETQLLREIHDPSVSFEEYSTFTSYHQYVLLIEESWSHVSNSTRSKFSGQ